MSQATGAKSARAPKAPKESVQTRPTPEQIRQRAYEIYDSRHGAPGDELADWLQAERELSSKQP